MEPKIVYQTDDHGIYVDIATADPCSLIPGFFLFPGGCVEKAPPETGQNQCAKWVDGDWQVIPDWRGHVYWTADRKQHRISSAGIAPPSDALDSDPGPSSEETKTLQIASIKAALSRLDKDKIRPLTDALLSGDMTRLREIEAQQQALRDELAALSS